mgnify:FL=1
MSKHEQQTFGNVEIDKAEGHGNCECGNSAKVRIVKNNETNRYCRNCARNTWLQEANQDND